ncbi:NBR1-Ig-like domain-containing protein [Paenibacillus sp. 481]|uniref:NBR1-Ig-like domain-containing protein n=1 Tax=Paenibacillus sp. 481 TaxID=2835869 RepID=UPI001E483D28|nr:NBR1-Ig-like domain-containing protein [Paenibacillus sp. 481]UHA73762.1 hypothetical protein KIK04_00890 [Paenibacillus sp. 481]
MNTFWMKWISSFMLVVCVGMIPNVVLADSTQAQQTELVNSENANTAHAAQIISHTIPDRMVARELYPVSVTVKNTGNLEWTEKQWFRLGAVGDSDPLSWQGRIVIPNDNKILSGQTYTFHFTMQAPTQKGVYTTDWRMVQDAVTWFGETLTLNVQVLGAEEPIVSHTLPTGLLVNEKKLVSIKIKNTSNEIWTTDQLSLQGQGAAASFQAGRVKPQAGISIRPGEYYTFEFPVVAPQQSGIYPLAWQLFKGNVAIGLALSTSIQVSAPMMTSQLLYDKNNQLTDVISLDKRMHMKYDAQGNMMSTLTTKNLVPNHDFEQHDLHWYMSNHMKVGTHFANKGSQIRFHSTEAVVGTTSESPMIAVTPNTQYVLKFDFLNRLSKGSFYVDTIELNEKNAVIYDGIAVLANKYGEWSSNSITITTQPTARKIIVRVVADSQATGEAFVDQIELRRVVN